MALGDVRTGDVRIGDVRTRMYQIIEKIVDNIYNSK